MHAALLMTDVVDSTALGERLGDAAMSALWHEHDRRARELLCHWRGREIDRSDGFLLLFPQAGDAAGFAHAYLAMLQALPTPMQARVGLHVGEVRDRTNGEQEVANGAKPIELDGRAKPATARIMATALGGQVLLSAAARAALVDTACRIESHGHWQLKGLDEPIELFELGTDGTRFLPPPDGDKAWRVVRQGELWLPRREIRHSLPAERDAFVGRQEDLFGLHVALREGARLVSVVGTGGTGKTRLAQRYGWTWLGSYPGGVWFCDLSQASTLDGVAYSAAQGLELPLGQDPVAQIGNAIAGRGRCLVILDNFEQVAAHAEATLGRWLDRAREAVFVVTTRELLGLPGEQEFALEPMVSQEAQALFLRRAQAARAGLDLTAEDRAAVAPLVQLLDCLPLAIELAAARVRVMSPTALLQRMSERFSLLAARTGRVARHSTLWATLDWSWDLLGEAEKRALAQLSVFEGGFDLAAAEAVLGAGAVDRLQSLVDKSLLRAGPHGRFHLLVSVQAYASAQLREPGAFEGSGPAAAARAERMHGSHYAGLSEDRVISHGCADLENVVVACRRAAARADGATCARLLANAWAGLRLRGPFGIGQQLALVCSAIHDIHPTDLLVAERIAGVAEFKRGRMGESRRHHEYEGALARRIGDEVAQARAAASIAELDMYAGDLDRASRGYRQALAVARREGERLLECVASSGMATCHEYAGRPHDAGACYADALALSEAIGDRRLIGGYLGNVGQFHANQGRTDLALSCYEPSLEIARELGDRQWEGNALCNLGLLEQARGDLRKASQLLDASLRIARELGHLRLECVAQCNLGLVLDAEGRWHDAQLQFESAIVIARKLGDRRFEGQALNYLGLTQSRQGLFAAAVASFDAATACSAAVSDRANLSLLWCSRAECALAAGDGEAARNYRESALRSLEGQDITAGSELGIALARLASVLD